MATAVRMMGEQYTGVKRSHYQMLDHVDTNLAFDGIPVQYHEMSRGGYYTPPPPGHQHTLYSNTPFPSSPATVQYIEDGGYLPSDNTMYTFTGTPVHQRSSFSEGFPSHVNESFGSTSSAASSCNVSLGPSTPPPQAFERNPMKFAPVPITPSSIQPRQKAKRTATACEECRKRKQKCDGEAPCQSCKEQKLDCKYREVQPTKKDNSMERLVSLVETANKTIEELNARLDLMTSTLQRMEKRLTRCHQCAGTVDLETGDCANCPQQIACRL